MREFSPQNQPLGPREQLKRTLEAYRQEWDRVLAATLNDIEKKALEERRRIFEEGMDRVLQRFEEQMKKLEEKRAGGMNEALLAAYEGSIRNELNILLQRYRTEMESLEN